MTRLNQEHITDLIRKNEGPCISIYQRTHPTGRERQQDPIRLKNLLTRAREQLKTRGLRAPEIQQLLSPAEELLDDSTFWQEQDRGLAIFAGADHFEVFRLPEPFESLVYVGEDYHVKPLLPVLQSTGEFYVLAMSKNVIRLLRGDQFEVIEVELEDVPTSLQEALRFDDPERQLQYHTGTAAPGGRGQRPSIYHGQGMPEADEQSDLLRYFQQVNRGMMDLLQEGRAPLVLAGVEYLLPIYREANDYQHVMAESIPGNPDERSAGDLHKTAWKIVAPFFEKDLEAALEKYRALGGAGEGLASGELSEILPAAVHGRVETLFVARDLQAWGTYDETGSAIERRDAFQPGDRDLLDLAAVETFKNGGQVYALNPEQMPEKEIAAVYRYKAT